MIKQLESALNNVLNVDLIRDKGRAYGKAKAEYIETINAIYGECANDSQSLSTLLYKLISIIEALKEPEPLNKQATYIKQDISTLTKERYSFIYVKTFFNSLNEVSFKAITNNKTMKQVFNDISRP